MGGRVWGATRNRKVSQSGHSASPPFSRATGEVSLLLGCGDVYIPLLAYENLH